MNVTGATASCRDCGGKTVFSAKNAIEIAPTDFFLHSPQMGYLKGADLVAACSVHHGGAVDRYDNSKPQHRTFDLYDGGGNLLGNFGVSSEYMNTTGLWIESNELRGRLSLEAAARGGPERW